VPSGVLTLLSCECAWPIPIHRNDQGSTVAIVTYQRCVSGIGNTPDMRRVVLGDMSPECVIWSALSKSHLSTRLMRVDGGARLG
jgi:hypothetical protein